MQQHTRETEVGMEEYSGPKIFIEDFYRGFQFGRGPGGAKGERFAKLMRLSQRFDEELSVLKIFKNGKDSRFC